MCATASACVGKRKAKQLWGAFRSNQKVEAKVESKEFKSIFGASARTESSGAGVGGAGATEDSTGMMGEEEELEWAATDRGKQTSIIVLPGRGDVRRVPQPTTQSLCVPQEYGGSACTRVLETLPVRAHCAL